MFHVKQMRKRFAGIVSRGTLAGDGQKAIICSTWNIYGESLAPQRAFQDYPAFRRRNLYGLIPNPRRFGCQDDSIGGPQPKQVPPRRSQLAAGPAEELCELAQSAACDEFKTSIRAGDVFHATAEGDGVLYAEFSNHLVQECELLSIRFDQCDVQTRGRQRQG